MDYFFIKGKPKGMLVFKYMMLNISSIFTSLFVWYILKYRVEKCASFYVKNTDSMGFPKHLNDSCAMDLSPVLCFGWEPFFFSRKHIISDPPGCLEMCKPCSVERADTHTNMWGTVWLKKAQMKKGWEETKEKKQWASLSQSTYNFLTCTLPQWPCLVISQHWLLHCGVTVMCFPHLYLSLSLSCCPQSCADCLTPTLHSSVLTSHTLSFPSGFFIASIIHLPPLCTAFQISGLTGVP